MNTRSACIAILCFGGTSLLFSSVQSCSKHKEGWSDEGHKTDFSHLDGLDASHHPTLSEKIKWVVKDHYKKGKASKDHKHIDHGHSVVSGGHITGSGLGYGYGAGGHHHEEGHHGGVAWSPPKHSKGPIVIQKGSIAPLIGNYQYHHQIPHGQVHHQQNHHGQEHHQHQQNHYNNAHHNNEGEDEGQNEIDHNNNDDNFDEEYYQGSVNKFQNAPPVQPNRNQWGPPGVSPGNPAHSYQYAAHNSNLVPRVMRPGGLSSTVSKYMQLEKIRHALGIKTSAE